MNQNLKEWVYTAPIEQVIARFNLAQGADRDDMIDAVLFATMQAIRDNNHARSSDLTTAFPDMRHWESAGDRRFKAKMRQANFSWVMKLMATALAIGAALYALKVYGFSPEPILDIRWVSALTVISIVLTCLGWSFQSDELFDERMSGGPSLKRTIGQWLSISGAVSIIAALLLSMIQIVPLI